MQTQADTGRHRQTHPSTWRNRQTHVGTGRHIQTHVHTCTHTQTQTDTHGQADTVNHRQIPAGIDIQAYTDRSMPTQLDTDIHMHTHA